MPSGGLALLLLVVAVEGCRAAAVQRPPALDSAYDTDAFFVPASRWAELGALLAQHKTVRLAAADYTGGPRGGAPNITVTSGMKIYGLPGTRLPTIIVAPGSTGVMLHKLEVSGLLYFPPAAADNPPTQFCSFFHISGPHVLFDGASVSDLQFVGLTDLGSPDPVPRDQSVAYTHGGIHVGNGASVINSKFVRLMVHNYCPTLTVALEPGKGEFRGNTVLWENSLGAMQATYRIAGAAEFTAVGSDIESYGSGFHEALLSVERSGAVRVYGVHGRMITHGPVASLDGDGGKDFGAFDLEADSVLNLRPVVARVLGPNMTLSNATANMILSPKTGAVVQFGGANFSTQDDGMSAAGNFRLLAANNCTCTEPVELCYSYNCTGTTGLLVNGKFEKADLGAADQASFAAVAAPPADRAGAPWGLPDFGLSDEARAALKQAALAAARLALPRQDDTAIIQAIIDSTNNTNETATLKAGSYFISSPLRLSAAGGRTYLIGAGAHKTFIFANDPTMSMVIGSGAGGGTTLNIAGLTLAGGAVGIHLSEATFGTHAQITESFMSHVLLANFSKAAVFADDVYGVDNNLFSHLTFEDCAIAWHQRAPQQNRGPDGACLQAFDNKNMNYMDKTVWYHTRVIGGASDQQAFWLDPCRGDGFNMFFESKFENLAAGIRMNDNVDETMIASSKFSNVGVPVSGGTGTTLLNSQISIGPQSQSALPSSECNPGTLPTPVCPGGGAIEGAVVTLAADANASATLFGPDLGGPMLVLNSDLAGMPLGGVDGKAQPRGPVSGLPAAAEWVLVNNRFRGSDLAAWNKVGVLLTGAADEKGAATAVLSSQASASKPRSQLLFGPAW
jgi:hypothetical protein